MSESHTFIYTRERERERERERKYTVNVQCSVQYALLLLYLTLAMSYCAYLSIKLHHIYVCYTNIALYIAFGIIRVPSNHGRSWNVLPADTAALLYEDLRGCPCTAGKYQC